tara:strand:+ start:1414 stop:1653 length:240 start_codon:yes stop_codon:yes gene_type:complete
MTIDKVSQDELHGQFKQRLQNIIAENQQLAQKIKENEAVALKLQGALETLEYYDPSLGEAPEETMSAPPDEEVDEADAE